MKTECVDNTLFEKLRTAYSQNKFFQKEFGLIMPEKIQLPLRVEDHGRFKAGKSKSFRRQDYVVVPLLPQLEQILNMEDVYNVIMNPPVSCQGSYSRFKAEVCTGLGSNASGSQRARGLLTRPPNPRSNRGSTQWVQPSKNSGWVGLPIVAYTLNKEIINNHYRSLK